MEQHYHDTAQEWFDKHLYLGGRVGIINPASVDPMPRLVLEAFRWAKKQIEIGIENKILNGLTLEDFMSHERDDCRNFRNGVKFMWMHEYAYMIENRSQGFGFNPIQIHPGRSRVLSRYIAGLDCRPIYVDYRLGKTSQEFEDNFQSFSNVDDFLHHCRYDGNLPDAFFRFPMRKEAHGNAGVIGKHYQWVFKTEFEVISFHHEDYHGRSAHEWYSYINRAISKINDLTILGEKI